MPDLIKYFDWNSYIVEGFPTFAPLGTRNMKSIFTCAVRLLGFEKLLIERPDLSGVTSELLRWNQQLLARWGSKLEIFFLGDDFAGNRGLFMNPEVWRTWLKPEYRKLLEVGRNLIKIFHSDGDIFDILEDLDELKVDVVSYEPVGRMKNIGKTWKNMQMILVEDQKQEHRNSMKLQR
jgi:hypothetical protein